MTKKAIYVELKAKDGKEEDVAKFLAGAQPLAVAEKGTITWYAVRMDKHTFAIFDTFDDDAGRDAHLNGPIAAALMQHAGDLLSTPPEIKKADVLADKQPG